MMLFLALILHFLLSLRAATAQQPTTPASLSFPSAAQDTSRRLALSSATPTSTNSLPIVIAQADSTVTTTTAAQAAAQTWPIHTLFLPIEDPGNLAASIISVHPNHTAYALGCLPPELRPSNATSCPSQLSPSMTITEGVSTVMYTQIFDDDEISPLTPTPIRVSCALFGADEDPINAHASKAACTAHSAISGLGIEAATTTLASTQITYVDVTVTDGQAKLLESATPVNGVSGSGEGTGGEEVDGGEGEGVENAAAHLRMWEGRGWARTFGLLVGAVGGGLMML